MQDLQPVSIELHHEIEQFLYNEALMLDKEMVRDWLSDVVHPDIRYQMVVTEERFRKDKSTSAARAVLPYDDGMQELELRVRQFETGLQTMMDPPQRLSRAVNNVQVFHGDSEREFVALSQGMLSRFRRQYEHEQVIYRREDILKRGDDNALRLLRRRIELGERVIRNKNLLLFL